MSILPLQLLSRLGMRRAPADQGGPAQGDASVTPHMGLINPAHWPRKIVYICERSDGQLAHLQDWVGSARGTLLPIHDRIIPDDWLRQYGQVFDMLIADADHLGGASEAVDFGLTLRRVVPQLPVILLSSAFKRHDFSAERQAICDASLRKPLSRSAFFLGVSAAVDNHLTKFGPTGCPNGAPALA